MAEDKYPNVLIIMTDQHRAEYMSCIEIINALRQKIEQNLSK